MPSNTKHHHACIKLAKHLNIVICFDSYAAIALRSFQNLLRECGRIESKSTEANDMIKTGRIDTRILNRIHWRPEEENEHSPELRPI